MSTKLVQQKMETLTVCDADRILEDKLPITINGSEKFATGLTKRTTVEDIIFAMLSVSDPSFKPDNLCEYGIVERWQGNERILDGKIKIYKLIRLWKSLPGDQLQQVKFIIKKRAMRLSSRNVNIEATTTKVAPKLETSKNNKFSYCTMSPSLTKTWNVEKSQRKNSFVQRQLEMAASENTFVTVYSDSDSTDIDSDTSEEESEENKLKNHKRFASIKRFNRSRKSSVRQIKKSFIELVNKQNEIIDKQLNQISDTRSKTKSLKGKKTIDINTEDIKEVFGEDKAEEYSIMCKNYFKLQNCLNSKLQTIDQLKTELEQIKTTPASEMHMQEKVAKMNMKLQSKIEVTNSQTEKLNDMSMTLNKADDVICLKEKFIQSLEQELQQLDYSNKKSMASTSESAKSSTSSIFTSISSILTSQYGSNNNANGNGLVQSSNKQQKFSYGDNESDTGISSANSEEFNSHLETLV